MNRFDILHDNQLGVYKQGLFYSETFSGVPYDLDLVFHKGVGREDELPSDPSTPTIILPWDYYLKVGKSQGGPQKTMRLIVLLHETSHLVHDLSLGVFLAKDSILDHTSNLVFICVRKIASRNTVVCPLLSEPGRSQWFSDPDLNMALSIVTEMESYTDRMFSECAIFPDNIIGVLKESSRLEVDSWSINGLSLIESLVVTRTFVVISSRIKDRKDEIYLRRHKDQLPIIPENLPATYSTPRLVFDAVFHYVLGSVSDYTKDDWPSSYFQSSRYLADCLFIYLADLALHIPPYGYIRSCIEKKINTWEDFVPASRFSKALATIIRQHGFPSHPSNELGYDYSRFFDWIAMKQTPMWPILRETNDAWKGLLAVMKHTRGEASDGYKFRMLVERDQRPDGVVIGDPLVSCWRQWIPVFHLTPTGLKTLSGYVIGDRAYIAPFEMPHMAPYDFFSKNYGLWTDASISENGTPLFDGQDNNQMIFRQEVIYRAICRELQKAILYKNNMSCPLSKIGCQVAISGCARITNFKDIPIEGCCIRKYLKQEQIETETLVWSQ